MYMSLSVLKDTGKYCELAINAYHVYITIVSQSIITALLMTNPTIPVTINGWRSLININYDQQHPKIVYILKCQTLFSIIICYVYVHSQGCFVC